MRAILAGFVVVFTLAACGGSQAPPPAAPPPPPQPMAPPPAAPVATAATPQPAPAAEVPPRPEPAPPAATTPAANAIAIDSCVGGAPVKTKDHGETQLIVRKEYALEHSATLKVPLWVCERIEVWELAGPADPNKAEFKPDPLLPAGKRAELTDYVGSEYEHGAQAPATDFKYQQARMNESFFLSNTAPQVGNGFNRSIWADLENHARKLARKNGGAYVITGGYFVGPVKTIGAGKVAVPTHFYKIIVAERGGELESIAYVLENKKYANQDFSEMAVPIDDIEAATGLDFMPMLGAPEQRALERLVGRL